MARREQQLAAVPLRDAWAQHAASVSTGDAWAIRALVRAEVAVGNRHQPVQVFHHHPEIVLEPPGVAAGGERLQHGDRGGGVLGRLDRAGRRGIEIAGVGARTKPSLNSSATVVTLGPPARGGSTM